MGRPVDSILAKVKKAANAAIQSTANSVADQMCKYAELSAIEWYGEYDTAYARQMGLVPAFERVCRNCGDYWEAGVIASAAFVAGSHRAGNDFIFSNSWCAGIHGNPASPWNAPATESPAVKLARYKESINLDSFAGKATASKIKSYFR